MRQQDQRDNVPFQGLAVGKGQGQGWTGSLVGYGLVRYTRKSWPG